MFSEAIDRKEVEKLSSRIVSACKRLYNRNLITGLGGNISIRTSDPDIILCSPSGIPLAEMLPDDLCIVRLKSKVRHIEASEAEKNRKDHDTCKTDLDSTKTDYPELYEFLSGKYSPTSEILIHCMVYKMRPETLSVIHTHPPYITAMTCIDDGVNFDLTEDKKYYIGHIGFVPFISGGSSKFAGAVASIAKQNNVIVCANHGIFVFGSSLSEAVNNSELVENLAKICFISRISGNKKLKKIDTDGIIEGCAEMKNNFIYRDEIFNS